MYPTAAEGASDVIVVAAVDSSAEEVFAHGAPEVGQHVTQRVQLFLDLELPTAPRPPIDT